MTTTTKKKKTTKTSRSLRHLAHYSETDIRIRKVKNGYTVTTFDKDYNDIVHIFHTEVEVRQYIEGLKF
jgi:hypothetical protein